MTKSMRLAYTPDTKVNVTLRGKSKLFPHRPGGYIRIGGKTISGWLGGDNDVFFAEGKNAQLANELIERTNEPQAVNY